MKLPASNHTRQRGSVLIIVLWVAFGLVALALYFANSMTFEVRAADNRVASMAADQAIASAARAISNRLATVALYREFGWPPDLYLAYYECESVPVGDARYWLLGRDPLQVGNMLADQAYFSVVDESSKLNLNTATLTMLEQLPRMTPQLAANIIAWRESTTNTTATDSFLTPAGNETYNTLNPAYSLKGAPFETVDELRLVYGATLDILYGEDANLNGILDKNENDGDLTAPPDNMDGRLDPGLFEYLTVYSQESLIGSDGYTLRVPIDGSDPTNLFILLEERLGGDKAAAITNVLAGGTGNINATTGNGARAGQDAGGSTTTAVTFTNLLRFYVAMHTNAYIELTADEFADVEGDLIGSTNTPIKGLVNVNTAPEAVLKCIPGIGYDAETNLLDYATQLVSQRQSYLTSVPTIAWIVDVIGAENAWLAAPYVTGRSYQCTVDVAALGYFDRGYRRAKFVFDTSEGWPRIVYRQDLTHLGWALGQELRRDLQLTKEKR